MNALLSLRHARTRLAKAAGQRLSRGVGLIDVLIAMLVLAGGVAGLSKMQAVVLEESGNAKARSVAVQLATAKLDDLRSYVQIVGGGNGIFGYAEIGANAGGSENGNGSLRMPAGDVTVANTTFTRNWTSQNLNYCAPNVAPQAGLCPGQPAGSLPQIKNLTVTVTWPDTEGLTQTVSLNGTANNIDPIAAITNLLLTVGEGPIVTYVPGQAPQVIAIDTGGGRKIETTNPTPTLVKRGQQVINTIARYETVSFDSANQTLRRRQFTTINCLCEQSGPSQGEDRYGNIVTKRTGVPADQFQAFECDICCRDHHDRSPECTPGSDSGRKDCYDPYRTAASEYLSGSGDHKHFNANAQAADNPGDVYLEACRMERIDGYLRVVPDWRLSTINAIPEDFFTSANVTNYGTWVKNYVASVLSGTASPTPIWSSSEVVNQGSQRQLLARAVYIDYLDSAQKSAYAARIAANDPTVFQEIPFYEVNMTKLAKWSSNAASVASVTNDQLVAEAEGQNLYSRGLVRGLSPGTADAKASVLMSNTGVIDEFLTVDTLDGAERQETSVTITVPGTTYTAVGTISGVAASVVVTITANGTGGSPNVACTYTASSNNFSCTLPSGWSGNLTASAGGYTFAPGSIAITNLSANQGSLVFVGTGASSTYTVSGLISPSVSASSTVTAVGSGSNANVTCTYDSGAGSYACPLPAGWSGTILPSSTTASFTPGSYGITSISANQTTGFDFISTAASSSYTISGTIAAPPSTVTVAMVGSPATAMCTAVATNGAYSCTVPAGWTGILTPTVDVVLGAGITFVQPSRSYPAGISSNVTGQDFVTHYRISGNVSPNTGTGIVTGVTFAANGTGTPPVNGDCTYDNATGDYACTVPGGWTGNIVPTRSGSTFSPVSEPYSTAVTSPFVDRNFIATPVATPSYTIPVTVSSLKNNQTAVTIATVSGLTCTGATESGPNNNKTATLSCSVPSGWNGSITPVVPHLGNDEAVTPPNRTYPNVTANQLTATFSVP